MNVRRGGPSRGLEPAQSAPGLWMRLFGARIAADIAKYAAYRGEADRVRAWEGGARRALARSHRKALSRS